MSEAPITVIKRLLSELSTKQLTQVRNSCQSLLDMQEQKDPNVRKQMLLYDIIQRSITAVTGASAQPYHVFVKTQNGKMLQKAVDRLDAMFAEHVPPMNRSEYRRAIQICVSAIVDHLQLYSGTLVTANVLKRVQEIEAYLDNQFPGYIRNGLGHMIFKVKK